MQIFRFYIKCTQCSAEITFKTDPKWVLLPVLMARRDCPITPNS